MSKIEFHTLSKKEKKDRKKAPMKTIIAFSTVLTIGGSGIDSTYNVASSDFVDAGLPAIAREVWHGQSFVRKHLFFLRMHAQAMFGPVAEWLFDPGFIALAIILASLIGALWIKASHGSQWWYKGAQGEVRGPFSTPCMFHWRSQGYIPDDLEVKCAAHASFTPLRELFPPPAVPFQSPPSPQPRSKSISMKELLPETAEHGNFEKEAFADMLRGQHEALENHAQDLEDEMIMTLEANLEEYVQSDDVSQQANRGEKESWDLLEKPLVVNPEELAEVQKWRAQRSVRRKAMELSQIRTSRYTADNKKRNSSEERIKKEFNKRSCDEMMSTLEAELEENLWSLMAK